MKAILWVLVLLLQNVPKKRKLVVLEREEMYIHVDKVKNDKIKIKN